MYENKREGYSGRNKELKVKNELNLEDSKPFSLTGTLIKERDKVNKNQAG